VRGDEETNVFRLIPYSRFTKYADMTPAITRVFFYALDGMGLHSNQISLARGSVGSASHAFFRQCF
jgi:hypothetical protein